MSELARTVHGRYDARMLMVTKLVHALMLITAVVFGSWMWIHCQAWLSHSGSFDGASLIWSRSGVVLATVTALLFGLPAMVLAASCGVAMRWTTGLMVLVIALGSVAVASGSINSLIWSFTPTSDASPGLRAMYLGLAFETLIWGVMMLSVAWGFFGLAGRARTRVPAAWLDHTSQQDNWRFDPWALIRNPGTKTFDALKCGGIVVVLGTLLMWVLCRNNEPGQVVGALVLSFGVASFVAQKLQPTRELSFALVAPFVSAVFSYVYAGLMSGSNVSMLKAWYVDGLWTPATALPIYYASAAVAGVLIGSAFGHPFAPATDASNSDGEPTPASSR